MKKCLLAFMTVAAIIGSTGCIGGNNAFMLTQKVYDFNKTWGEKWMQELGFLVMNIVPVYGISMWVDVIVLNSIDFWTGSNPLASTKTMELNGQTVKMTHEADDSITVATDKGSFRLIKQGENVLAFDMAGNPLKAM